MDLWWGRWDLNPGSRTPQARILNHARRRPHVRGFSLDDGPAFFEAMLRPH
jgi:hypothetical protein